MCKETSKHTPGPWKVDISVCYVGLESFIEEHGAIPINIPRGLGLGACGMLVMPDIVGEDEAHANAVLIAAAPETAAERDRLREVNAELLSALEGLVAMTEGCGSIRCWDKARDAITTARGE